MAAIAAAPPVLETARLRLSFLTPADAPRTLAFFRRNRAHFEPWDPPRPADFYTLDYHRAQIQKYLDRFAEDANARFWMTTRENPLGDVIGLVHFSRSVRGAFQCAGLGYSLDERYVGRGLMQEALRAAIAWIFSTGFHRIEANYRPENIRSGRVLAALGFKVEGYARDYLLIGDRWTDHVLTSLTKPA